MKMTSIGRFPMSYVIPMCFRWYSCTPNSISKIFAIVLRHVGIGGNQAIARTFSRIASVFSFRDITCNLVEKGIVNTTQYIPTLNATTCNSRLAGLTKWRLPFSSSGTGNHWVNRSVLQDFLYVLCNLGDVHICEILCCG